MYRKGGEHYQITRTQSIRIGVTQNIVITCAWLDRSGIVCYNARMDNNDSSQKPQPKPIVVWKHYPEKKDRWLFGCPYPACCGKAKVVFCVCRVRYSCPDHGDRCHGSHD